MPTPKEQLIIDLYNTFSNQYVGTLTEEQILGIEVLSDDLGTDIDTYHISQGGSSGTTGATSYWEEDGDDIINNNVDGVIIKDYLYVDTINEYTTDNGISIDGLIIKDGRVFNSTSTAPTTDSELVNKKYVDDNSGGSGNYLDLSGGTMTGDISLGNNSITNLATPVNDNDAVNKSYIDDLTGTTAFSAYASTSQSQSGVGEIEINFNSEIKKDGGYTHSTTTNPNQITVLNSGWYNINYSISWDSDYNSRTSQRAWIEVNSSAISYSYSYCYLRYNTYGRYGTTNATFMIYLSANDVITLHADQAALGTFGTTYDVDTIANKSWINIQPVGGLKGGGSEWGRTGDDIYYNYGDVSIGGGGLIVSNDIETENGDFIVDGNSGSSGTFTFVDNDSVIRTLTFYGGICTNIN